MVKVSQKTLKQRSMQSASPQKLRWGPSDGLAAGVRVFSDYGSECEFIPWSELKVELERQLMPQLFADPSGFTFETRDYEGKSQWRVQISDKAASRYCDVWFGHDPDSGWAFDGLLRFGDPDETPHVWQTYQRYSDATYRRCSSMSATLDEFVRRQSRPKS
jgi:hypothetical protein